jgi:hypothetical protein
VHQQIKSSRKTVHIAGYGLRDSGLQPTGADMKLQVEYFKKQRVVNYQKEQTIKKIEAEGGEIIAPQLPLKK